MESFKIQHFEKLHGVPFPEMRTLTEAECSEIRSLVRLRLHLPESADSVAIITVLDRLQHFVPGVSAEEASFDLMRLLPERAASGNVLINWSRFDAIDEVDAVTLATFFDDFWYPAADDIDILDSGVSWVVSVRHDGVVKLAEFEPVV